MPSDNMAQITEELPRRLVINQRPVILGAKLEETSRKLD